MPLQRGVLYRLEGAVSPESIGAVVLTHNPWNDTMHQAGIVVVRSALAAVEQPHAVPLASGGCAVVTRLTSESMPGQPDSIIGPSELALPQAELDAIEDKLVQLLELPLLLSGRARTLPLAGSATPYPLWGDVYYAGPRIGTERKRFVVISPNRWNAVGGYATCVRTTTSFKGRPLQFPRVLTYPDQPAAFACCGDATTFATHMFDQRERPPRPTHASLADMVAISKGLVVTHDLAAAVARNPVP